jgi:hypothetical protein
VVESLEADFAEFKEAQFQLKVHEKEIQLITEVRDAGYLPQPSKSIKPLSLRAHCGDPLTCWAALCAGHQLIARGWEVAYNNGTAVGGRRTIVFRRKLH